MTAPDPATVLAEMRARCDAATPGPWHNYSVNPKTTPEHAIYSEWLEGIPEAITSEIASLLSPRDAHFIAHARTDVPRLIAALRAVLDRHKPRYDLKTPAGTTPVCDVCGDPDGWADPWPCADVRTITEALKEGS